VAKLSLSRGKSDPDIDRLTKLLPESFARLAEVYLARGERQKALELLEQYAEQFPGYPTGFWMLGKIYYGSGEKEKALSFLHKTLQIIPEHPAALQLIGKIYMENGEPAMARSYLKQVSQIDQLGEVVFKSAGAQTEEKVDAGKLTKSAEPAKGRFATETMVNLYLKQGHKTLARELCEQILVSEPDNSRIKTILKDLEN
jgi:tetratricopeptide (TPR) repeat protein